MERPKAGRKGKQIEKPSDIIGRLGKSTPIRQTFFPVRAEFPLLPAFSLGWWQTYYSEVKSVCQVSITV